MSFVDSDTLLKVAEVVGGSEAMRIVETLSDGEEKTDEEIVSKTQINLNDVRRILYKLYGHSLVSLRRTRDKETGWFTFHWRLQPDQMDGFIHNQKRRILDKLKARLEYETNHDFYYCNTWGCKRVPFEEAVELVFQCPTCKKQLSHFDNSKMIDFLTLKVDQLRKELGG